MIEKSSAGSNETMSDYTFGIKELDNATMGIKKGSNIMLIGPSMSGKEAILSQIMNNER